MNCHFRVHALARVQLMSYWPINLSEITDKNKDFFVFVFFIAMLSSFRRISASPLLVRSFSVATPESSQAGGIPVHVYNPKGDKRVVVTKPLPGYCDL